MTERLPSYGGQAVIEGVMMRGTKVAVMAVRTPQGIIKIHSESLPNIYHNFISRIPFLRGLILLWDSLGLGMRFLTISANFQTGEDETIEGPAMFITMAVSLVIAVGAFFLAPAIVGQLAERWMGINAWWSNLFEGILRFILLISYIWVVGKMPDIRRVFSYHGAEHKTINAFESGALLTPDLVTHYSVEHPRCGTAFLLTLVVISIIIFSVLGPLPTLWRLSSRVLLLPVIAGLAYEFIRWTSRHLDSPWVRALVKPNLALQHLTTREPTIDMLEVSIAAFNAMLALETAKTD